MPGLRDHRRTQAAITVIPVVTMSIAQSLSLMGSPFARGTLGATHLLACVYKYLHFALWGVLVNVLPVPRSNYSPQSIQLPRLYEWLATGLLIALESLANNTILNDAPLMPMIVILTIITVIPVAFVISMAYSRIPAAKNYMTSLLRLRGIWGWVLLALIWFPALIIVSIIIKAPRSGLPITIHYLPATGLPLVGLVAVIFIYQFFFFNASGEETGWRGFALPWLQARVTPWLPAWCSMFFGRSGTTSSGWQKGNRFLLQSIGGRPT
jgi:membrane protease YdiL (CAAX protease family)